MALTLIALPLSTLATVSYAALSQNGSVLASTTSHDTALHVKAVRGRNLEGDSVWLLYRRPGEFFYHPFGHLGGDLLTITAIRITFLSAHHVEIQADLTGNIPGHPSTTTTTRYDLTPSAVPSPS